MKTKERRRRVCHRGAEGTEIGEDGCVRSCQEEFQLDRRMELCSCSGHHTPGVPQNRRDAIPRAFCEKRLYLSDSKDFDFLGDDKEAAIVSKERG